MTTSAPSYSKAEYTGENEWFTPSAWVERAREVLGEIDLDPASHTIAQETVRAKTFFTIADNGLNGRGSAGFVLNPPYNRELLSRLRRQAGRGMGERTRSSRRSCSPTTIPTLDGFIRPRERRAPSAFQAVESTSFRLPATSAIRPRARRCSISAAMTKPSAGRSPASASS